MLLTLPLPQLAPKRLRKNSLLHQVNLCQHGFGGGFALLFLFEEAIEYAGDFLLLRKGGQSYWEVFKLFGIDRGQIGGLLGTA